MCKNIKVLPKISQILNFHLSNIRIFGEKMRFLWEDSPNHNWWIPPTSVAAGSRAHARSHMAASPTRRCQEKPSLPKLSVLSWTQHTTAQANAQTLLINKCMTPIEAHHKKKDWRFFQLLLLFRHCLYSNILLKHFLALCRSNLFHPAHVAFK